MVILFKENIKKGEFMRGIYAVSYTIEENHVMVKKKIYYDMTVNIQAIITGLKHRKATNIVCNIE